MVKQAEQPAKGDHTGCSLRRHRLEGQIWNKPNVSCGANIGEHRREASPEESNYRKLAEVDSELQIGCVRHENLEKGERTAIRAKI